MTSRNIEIATLILNQMGGSKRLSVMIGARNFMADTNALSFRFPANGKIKANYFKVALNNSDRYDTELGRIHGDSYTVLEQGSNLYFDQLIGYFEEHTGLYLSL